MSYLTKEKNKAKENIDVIFIYKKMPEMNKDELKECRKNKFKSVD
jgi:hypothetical protein